MISDSVYKDCSQEDIVENIKKEGSLRKDTLHIKNKLVRALGDRGSDYWAKFKNFINGKYTKTEFDTIVLRALRRVEYVKLHNEFLLAIIYNVSKKLFPPSIHHRGFGTPDQMTSLTSLKPKHRMSTRIWNEKFMLRIIRSFSKKEYFRLVKLSQSLSRTPKDSFAYRQIYLRECNSTLDKRAEAILSGSRKPPKLCEELGSFPPSETAREIQLFYSYLEGLPQDKESRSCADLIMLGAKYMIKNYISRVLIDPRTLHESEGQQLSNFNHQTPIQEHVLSLNTNAKKEDTSSRRIRSIYDTNHNNNLKRCNEQLTTSWYNEQVLELYKKKMNSLSGQTDLFKDVVFIDDDMKDHNTIINGTDTLGMSHFPLVRENYLDAINSGVNDNDFKPKSNIEITQDRYISVINSQAPSFSAHRSMNLTNSKLSDQPLADYIPNHNCSTKYVNIPTPYSIEKCTSTYVPFVPLDSDQPQGTASQASFDLRNSGISSLSSVNTFNKLLLRSDPVLIQKHVSINGSLGLKSDQSTVLDLDDIYFRSYLDFHILAPSYAATRLLEALRTDHDILENNN